MGESCKNICRRHGVEMFFKEATPSKSSWYTPKTEMPSRKRVVYRFRCGRVNCEEEYIGKSGRTFAEVQRAHKAPSPIHDHHNITSHEVSLDNFSIVGSEDHNIARSIKEAILIGVNDPSLNRNIGKYQLPHIWEGCWSGHQN